MRETVAALEKDPGVHQGTNTGFIGAALETVTPDLGVQLNYKGVGVAVAQVTSGGPADQAGIAPGDVIQKVNGQAVTTNDEVVKAIRATKPGSTIAMEVWSAGVKKLVTIRVTERPADVGDAQPQNQDQDQQQGPFSGSNQP